MLDIEMTIELKVTKFDLYIWDKNNQLHKFLFFQ